MDLKVYVFFEEKSKMLNKQHKSKYQEYSDKFKTQKKLIGISTEKRTQRKTRN